MASRSSPIDIRPRGSRRAQRGEDVAMGMATVQSPSFQADISSSAPVINLVDQKALSYVGSGDRRPASRASAVDCHAKPIHARKLPPLRGSPEEKSDDSFGEVLNRSRGRWWEASHSGHVEFGGSPRNGPRKCLLGMSCPVDLFAYAAPQVTSVVGDSLSDGIAKAASSIEPNEQGVLHGRMIPMSDHVVPVRKRNLQRRSETFCYRSMNQRTPHASDIRVEEAETFARSPPTRSSTFTSGSCMSSLKPRPPSSPQKYSDSPRTPRTRMGSIDAVGREAGPVSPVERPSYPLGPSTDMRKFRPAANQQRLHPGMFDKLDTSELCHIRERNSLLSSNISGPVVSWT